MASPMARVMAWHHVEAATYGRPFAPFSPSCALTKACVDENGHGKMTPVATKIAAGSIVAENLT
jgi:hypothetical protein